MGRLKENGIQTHFIDDLDKRSIIVEPALLFFPRGKRAVQV